MGFDPVLDTWPISQDDLQTLLTSATPLDATSIARLEPEVKGFHALEYVLFGDRATKRAADLTPRELEYASLVAAEMQDIASTLRQAWTDGVDGEPPFRTLVVNAGDDNAMYDSPTAVVEEMPGRDLGDLERGSRGRSACR